MVRAPTQAIEVEAAGERADRLARFARRLEAIRSGRQAYAGAESTDPHAAVGAAGPRRPGET